MDIIARLQYKAMIDSWSAFNNAVELSAQALETGKIQQYANLKQLVHETFFKFDKYYRNYKTDVNDKADKNKKMF